MLHIRHIPQFAIVDTTTWSPGRTSVTSAPHAADSPFGAKLDAYEWILFVGTHSERHTKQILEVKADPNFPKQ